MILQSLQKLANREGLTENPDYEVREVHWVINLKPDGRFISLDSLLQPLSTNVVRKKWKPRGRKTRVPRQSGRTSGDKAELLVDKAEYVLGFANGDKAKIARRQKLFFEEVGKAVTATNDSGVKTVQAFLSSKQELIKARRALETHKQAKEWEPNHLLAFHLDRDRVPYIHMRPAVDSYCSSFVGDAFGSKRIGQCLVTGETSPLARKYPVIKNVPPVSKTKGGVHVTAIDDGSSAYHSYGWAGNDNAPLSVAAAFAYVDALNRLLDPSFPDPNDENVKLPEQRVLLSEDTVAVFWTDEPSPVPSAIAPAVGLGDPDAANALGVALEVDESYEELAEEEEPLSSVEPLRVAHEAPWKGLKPEQLLDPGIFRLLILSGGQGRATVRSFQTSSVRHIVSAVQRWFEDIRLSSMRGKPALGRLLRSLSVRGEIKNMHPNLAAEVFLAILSDRPLPLLVLENCMRRCRSEPDKRQIRGKSMQGLKATPERIALIKAWLNRALRSRARSPALLPREITFKEVKPTMNEEEHNKGYLLGRMFACIERMQELALGDVGASVTDRYFGSACAAPQVVFPRLLKNELHHYRKAKEGQRGGYARWVHFQIDRLSEWLVGEANGMGAGEAIDSFLRRIAGRPLAGFPTFLPLPEQGLFALGYHQQRAEFFKRRKEEPEGEEDLAEQK